MLKEKKIIIRAVCCIMLRCLNMSMKGIQYFYKNNSYSYATPNGPTGENGEEEKSF